MMPLGMANVGDVNIIKKINGRDEVRQHLAELGFVVGTEVTVVSELGGYVILHVKESRIALDKTIAMRIMVSSLESISLGLLAWPVLKEPSWPVFML